MTSSAPELQGFVDRAERLVGQLEEAQISVPEDSTILGGEHPMVTDAVRLVGQAIDLIRALDESTDRAGPFSDFSFLAGLELGAAREELRAPGGRKAWQALGGAASAMSRAARALVALESEVCDELGIEPPRHPGPLDESLRIRQEYALFRDGLLEDDPPEDQLLDRLREAAGQLQRLRELEVTPLMRVHDRRQTRSLLGRLQAAGERGEADAAAWALWQDVRAAGELFLQINLRHVLVEHDRDFLSQVDPGPRERENADGLEVWAACQRPLLGRDRELDEVLLHPDRFDDATASERLSRLRARVLGPHEPGLDER